MSKPFLKWPGGKRWLVPLIREMLDGRPLNRYYEPFLGGGAVFFAIQPKSATLSDVNNELITTYKQVKRVPELLIEMLKNIPVTKESYLEVRASEPSDPIEVAVRFLYLNRTAFGGVYRVNQQGRFNVPYGGGQRTPKPLWKHQLLEQASYALRRASIQHCDFDRSLASASKGDVVYCDPTYTVMHNNNGFIRYNENNFSWEDQIRLANTCREAANRGSLVLVSNAHHAEVAALYPDAERITVNRRSLISPVVTARVGTQEDLFVLDGHL